MSKILVTGCAGYIGSVLLQHLLADGHEVIGVDNLWYGNYEGVAPHLGHPKFTFVMADAREPSDWFDFTADVIIPLAALVGAPICEQYVLDARQTNVLAIRRLMRLVQPHQRVIFPNTNSGYGQTDGSSEVTEYDRLSPVSHYGRTKCEAEALVLGHKNSVVLRLATVFGVSPRMRFDLMVNDFCQTLHDLNRYQVPPGELKIFEPNFLRNFIHVRDVARIFVHCLNQQNLSAHGGSGVFNCGHPEANLSKLQLAEKIESLLSPGRDGKETLIVEGEGKDPDQRNYKVSNRKLLQTGFEFKHTLDQGIAEVLAFCAATDKTQRRRMRNA